MKDLHVLKNEYYKIKLPLYNLSLIRIYNLNWGFYFID